MTSTSDGDARRGDPPVHRRSRARQRRVAVRPARDRVRDTREAPDEAERGVGTCFRFASAGSTRGSARAGPTTFRCRTTRRPAREDLGDRHLGRRYGDDRLRLRRRRSGLVEFAARSMYDGATFETLVNPGRDIPIIVQAVHGITNGMVASAPSLEEAYSADQSRAAARRP